MLSNSLPIAVALFGFILSTIAQDCYFPDKSVHSSGRICDVAAVEANGHSACCNANDACFSDGTCATQDGNVGYRGSCTDKTWKDGACASNICTRENQGANISRIVWIEKCNLRRDKACCLGAPDTCCDNLTKFPQFVYRPGAILGILDSAGNNILSATTSAAPTTSSSVSPTSSPADEVSTGPSNNGAAIGLGVVLGVVILAAVGGTWFLWSKLRSERGLRRQAEEALSSIQSQGPAAWVKPQDMYSQSPGYSSPFTQQTTGTTAHTFPTELSTMSPHVELPTNNQ